MPDQQDTPIMTPPIESPLLRPSDHLKLMSRLFEPLGPELARRWVAALMLVDADQRQGVVERVERQIAAEFVHENDTESYR